MHIQEGAGVIAQGTPCIQEMSFAIVFHDFRGGIFESPYCAITVCIYEVHRRWIVELPLIEEFAVFIEYLHSAIPTIADVDTTSHGIGGNAVNDIEVAGPRFSAAGFAFLAPCSYEFPILVELHHPVSV